MSLHLHLCLFSFLSPSLFTHRNGINQSNDSTNEERSCTKSRQNYQFVHPLSLVSFSRVVSNNAIDATPGGALFFSPLFISISLHFHFPCLVLHLLFHLLSPLVLSSPLSFCLVFSSSVFSCLLFLCLSLSLSVSAVSQCLCLLVVLWSCCCCVVVYTLKKTRVYVQNVAMSTGTAYMLKHMCAWCRYTRGRFERTHGDALNGHTGGRGSSPVLLTRICPHRVITCLRGPPWKPLDLSHFQV